MRHGFHDFLLLVTWIMQEKHSINLVLDSFKLPNIATGPGSSNCFGLSFADIYSGDCFRWHTLPSAPHARYFHTFLSNAWKENMDPSTAGNPMLHLPFLAWKKIPLYKVEQLQLVSLFKRVKFLWNLFHNPWAREILQILFLHCMRHNLSWISQPLEHATQHRIGKKTYSPSCRPAFGYRAEPHCVFRGNICRYTSGIPWDICSNICQWGQ